MTPVDVSGDATSAHIDSKPYSHGGTISGEIADLIDNYTIMNSEPVNGE